MWTRDADRPADQAARSASHALMPLAKARALLLDGLGPVPAGLRILPEAIGRRLANDCIAEADLPGRATALRDGWAVRADSVTGASANSPIYLPQPPAWIEAGSSLEAGADTVLEPDAIPSTDLPRGRIAIVADAPEGEGIREIGRELGKGVVIAAAGTRLTPLHAIALRGCGIDEVAVRVPVIRLVAANPHADGPCTALAALIAADGGIATGPSAAVGVDAVAEALVGEGADAVFVVGGTGLGRTDHSAAALRGAGSLQAHGIALRPGESAGFGRAAGRPVLLVPGRSDAALAAYLTLGRPLLEVLTGAPGDRLGRAPLLRKVVSTLGVSEIVFARMIAAGIEPLGGVEIPLHRLILADAAILVPPEREGYPEGTTVEVISW